MLAFGLLYPWGPREQLEKGEKRAEKGGKTKKKELIVAKKDYLRLKSWSQLANFPEMQSEDQLNRCQGVATQAAPGKRLALHRIPWCFEFLYSIRC